MSLTFFNAARAIVATLLLGSCLQTSAGERSSAGLERADAELRKVLSYELANVKSRSDLATHLRRAGSQSPLNALSPAARERFVDSLVFNEKGLTEYRYDDLQHELTVTQAYRILRLFGAADSAPFLRRMRVNDEVDAGIALMRAMAVDHDKAMCIARGTCEKHNPNHICTSNC